MVYQSSGPSSYSAQGSQNLHGFQSSQAGMMGSYPQAGLQSYGQASMTGSSYSQGNNAVMMGAAQAAQAMLNQQRDQSVAMARSMSPKSMSSQYSQQQMGGQLSHRSQQMGGQLSPRSQQQMGGQLSHRSQQMGGQLSPRSSGMYSPGGTEYGQRSPGGSYYAQRSPNGTYSKRWTGFEPEKLSWNSQQMSAPSNSWKNQGPNSPGGSNYGYHSPGGSYWTAGPEVANRRKYSWPASQSSSLPTVSMGQNAMPRTMSPRSSGSFVLPPNLVQ